MSWKNTPARYIGAELGAVVGTMTGYFLGSPAPYEELLLGATAGYTFGSLGFDLSRVTDSWFDNRRKESELVKRVQSSSAKTEDGIES
ncbi:TPA: hypothetical protein HA371_02520 [Candidatus Woesearchaeota archaeon]|nr:hypothetical protein [Candidatus Woesearchaeota archaeon]